MSIADQINRLINAKAAIKQSIVNKGVDVSDSALLDEYPALIDSISGSGADPFYRTMWNYITNNGTNYSYLFHNYNGKTIDLSNLDTSNVTDMSYMFYECSKLTSLDISNFDTGNATSMVRMFAQTSLTSIDVSHFDISNVTDISYMFYIDTNLTSIGDVSNWDISNVINMGYMFYNCTSLTELDLSNWDISKITNLGGAFDYCTSLVDFKAPKNISANMNVSNSKALSHDSLMSIINNLITVTSSKTLTLGADNLAKLTADEIAIATNKGWTVK